MCFHVHISPLCAPEQHQDPGPELELCAVDLAVFVLHQGWFESALVPMCAPARPSQCGFSAWSLRSDQLGLIHTLLEHY